MCNYLTPRSCWQIYFKIFSNILSSINGSSFSGKGTQKNPDPFYRNCPGWTTTCGVCSQTKCHRMVFMQLVRTPRGCLYCIVVIRYSQLFLKTTEMSLWLYASRLHNFYKPQRIIFSSLNILNAKSFNFHCMFRMRSFLCPRFVFLASAIEVQYSTVAKIKYT